MGRGSFDCNSCRGHGKFKMQQRLKAEYDVETFNWFSSKDIPNEVLLTCKANELNVIEF